MKAHWQEALAKYFLIIDDFDQQIEKIREDICNNKEFSPKELFDFLDKDKKKFLSLNDLDSFSRDKISSYEEQSLRRVIHNFDKDGDFAINYQEFLSLISSKSYSPSKEESPKENDENIKPEILVAFSAILEKEMQLVKELVSVAEELKNSKDFTTYEAFVMITGSDKYITKENLSLFLKGLSQEPQDIERVIYRLDADNDGRISYDEFQEIFFPYVSYVKARYNPTLSQSQYNKSYAPRNILTTSTTNSNFRPDPLQKTYNVISCSNQKKLTSSPLGYDYKKCSPKKNNISLSPRLDKKDLSKSFYNVGLDTSIIANAPRAYVGYKSSPRRDVNYDSVLDVNSRARMNTYTSPLRTNIGRNINNTDIIGNAIPRNNIYPSAQTCFFNRSARFSPNRSKLTGTLSYNTFNYANTLDTPHCHCNHCNLSVCSCCCIDHLRRRNLFNLICDLVDTDVKVESVKERLAFCQDGNLNDLFAFFDYDNRGSISVIDFSRAFKEMNLYLSMSDIKLIFKRFDRNLDGRLDYQEFCQMILPKKYSLAKLMNDRYPPITFYGFSYETKGILCELFTTIIEGEKSNERYRGVLASTPNSSAFDCFGTIKKSYCDGVYKDDLVEFMENNGRYLNGNECDLLIDRLDKNDDGIISYNEFLMEIAPRL